MSTQLKRPAPDDAPKLYDGYATFIESKTAGFLMKKLENARVSMEAAAGTAMHPRLVVEHQLAQVQLDNAILEEKLKAVQQYAHDQNEQLQDVRASMGYFRDFLDAIPQRILLLENSYASLHMAAHKNHFVDSVVEAYKIGLANKTKQQEESNAKRDRVAGEKSIIHPVSSGPENG